MGNVQTDMKAWLVVPVALLAVACGSGGADRSGGPVVQSASPSPSEDQRYRGYGMVLEEKGAAPQLCMGVVLESYPPQCEGLALEGWDWDAVSGEESSGGITWGDYEVTGYYDGETFDLIDARPPPPPATPPDEDPIANACEEPAGGWPMPDPELTSDQDRQNAHGAAQDEPDYSGGWITYLEEPSEFTEAQDTVLNLAFTGDPEEHEDEIREHWGGALCVARYERTKSELSRIQNEIADDDGATLGLEVLHSGLSEPRNVVLVTVVILTPEMDAAIEERYGEGTVEVTPRLAPIP